jgi:hypothetical protein
MEAHQGRWQPQWGLDAAESHQGGWNLYHNLLYEWNHEEPMMRAVQSSRCVF